MITNQDRAVEVMRNFWHDGRYAVGFDEIAEALADAGLLTPDLTEPNHADEDGTLDWNIPDPEQPYQGIVRLYPHGNIRLVQINAPIKNPATALALSRALAAAAYIQTHQEKI